MNKGEPPARGVISAKWQSILAAIYERLRTSCEDEFCRSSKSDASSDSTSKNAIRRWTNTKGKAVCENTQKRAKHFNMEPKQVLHALRLPARLTVEQAAALLGVHDDAIGILMKAKMLEPLGGHAPGAQRTFAAVEIQRLHDDLKWLSKATRLLREHFQIKNSKRKSSAEHPGIGQP